jgi:hypothetical protein
MNCNEVSSKMVDFLDKQLSGEEIKLIEKHLESCERCMDEVRDLQSVLVKISDVQMEIPDASLRSGFYSMLHAEMGKQNRDSLAKGRKMVPLTKIAAGLALLIAGTFLGMIINPILKNQSSELVQLKSEIQSVKEVMMMNMLNQESPSERIKAVNYAEELSANDQVVQALVKTLNTDKNMNVRMAAAYSLSKLSARKDVLDSLVKSLEIQTDPIIQVVLMDILVQNRETRAVTPIQNIISNENTINEVKEIAKKNMQVLL